MTGPLVDADLFRPRVGVDLVSIPAVLSSIDLFGARYVDRLFTSGEQADCRGEPEVRAAGLAGRFAAKEAVIKALAVRDDIPTWREIEVVTRRGGSCGLRLHGTAKRLATEQSLSKWSVSMAHEGATAVAVVVALSDICTPED